MIFTPVLNSLLVTANALEHYARTVPAVVDRVRTAQVRADACDRFVPCAAPVLTETDADGALASLRARGYALVESGGLAARWLAGARALTADGPLRGVWGSAAAEGRPDTLWGGYGGRTAVYVDIRWDAAGRTLPRECGAAAPALEGCHDAERLALRLLDAARVPRDTVDGPGAARPGRAGVSAASLRLCRYAPVHGEDAAEAPWSTCRPHADAAWLVVAPVGPVPGLAVYDEGQGAWVEPERGRAGALLVWSGLLLEAHDPAYRAAVHMVRRADRERVSAPLLLRGAPDSGDMRAVWRALQADDAARGRGRVWTRISLLAATASRRHRDGVSWRWHLGAIGG